MTQDIGNTPPAQDDINDVLIVGCGPTGMVLALLIARYGHSVTMIERHATLYPLPRAIAFDHETARVLDSVGVSEAMAPLVGRPGVYEWRNADRDLLFQLVWNGPGLSGFPHSYVFSQPQMEAVLNAAAQAEPRIRIHRGLEALTLSQEGNRVTLRAAPPEALTDVREFQARYLVGADGANSVIRGAIGSTLQDLGFSADWLVVDVLPSHPDVKLPVDDDVMMQVCDPARPTTVVSGGPGRRRWEFMALAGETLDDLNSPERAWQLLAPWGVDPGNAILERHAVYRFRGAVADKWREGRVFIAGDAAHLTPPFAGQGLCAGVRDAAALAWRLNLALLGGTSEILLDSYGSERQEHAATWVSNAIELGKVVCVLDPEAAAARDKFLLASRENPALTPQFPALPLLGPGIVLEGKGSGQLALGGRVVVEGRAAHLDHAIGRGFVLLSRSGDPVAGLTPDTLAFWGRVGGISVDLSPQGRVRDIDGRYTAWLDELGVDTVLIRPDFYVFGSGNGDGAAERLVGGLRSFLAC